MSFTGIVNRKWSTKGLMGALLIGVLAGFSSALALVVFRQFERRWHLNENWTVMRRGELYANQFVKVPVTLLTGVEASDSPLSKDCVRIAEIDGAGRVLLVAPVDVWKRVDHLDEGRNH